MLRFDDIVSNVATRMQSTALRAHVVPAFLSVSWSSAAASGNVEVAERRVQKSRDKASSCSANAPLVVSPYLAGNG